MLHCVFALGPVEKLRMMDIDHWSLLILTKRGHKKHMRTHMNVLKKQSN